MRSRTTFALLVGALGMTAVAAGEADAQVIAQTGFNDASGINSTLTANSPYTIDQTVADRGEGEPGWGGQWRALNGGAEGGDPFAIVRGTSPFEGDGRLALTQGSFGTTSVQRRLGVSQTERLVFETRLNFGSVGDLQGIALMDNFPLSADKDGPKWIVTGGVDDRHFEVFDGQSNQLGTWEDTGIAQTPGEYQNVVIDVNVVTQRFTFSVDGVPYNAPDPLGFFNNPSEINAIAYLTNGAGSIDSVIVRAVPEPATTSVIVAGLSLLASRRRLAGR